MKKSIKQVENFGNFKIISEEHLLAGVPSAETIALRDVKAEAGIPLDPAKRKDGVLKGEFFGIEIDGRVGIAGYSREKRQLLQIFLIHLLTFNLPPQDLTLTALGKLCFAFQFRRPLYSILYHAFRWPWRYNRETATDELVLAMLLLPFAQSDLRAQVSPEISSSDASPTGGAAGVALSTSSEVGELIRATDFRGSAVRLDEGRTFQPLTPFPCGHYRWKTKHFYPWKHEQHIVLLETSAYLLYLRKRARSLSNHHQKFLHVMDAATAIGGIAKGRSSSWRFNRLLRRIGSLLISTSQRSFLAWTSTDLMPMDGPSRAFERHRRKKVAEK